MKKNSTIKRFQLMLLAAVTIFALQFHGFAYKPEIITQGIPEAVSGSFYYVRLLAAGFGKNAAWSAEGLPHGLRIEPDEGVIFGAAENPGVYEILVTVKSGDKRKERSESKLFRLAVLPRPTEEPPVYTAPAPQAVAEGPALLAATGLPEVEWLGVRANGISGLETTTVLFLDFSEEIPWPVLDYDTSQENIKILKISGGAVAGEAAEIDFLSMSGATRELHIKSIDASVEDGEEVKVVIELSFPGYYELSPDSMTVRLNVASDDFIKGTSDLNALVPENLLGANTSADALTANLSLPDLGTVHGCAISWQSSDSGVVSDSGFVTRPKYGETDKPVTLTATITCGARNASRDFLFTVKAITEAPPEILPEVTPEVIPEILPNVAPSAPQSSGRESGSGRSGISQPFAARTSPNVNKGGAVSRAAAASELEAAFRAGQGKTAVIKTQNAKSISPKTLKALAEAADKNSKQVVLYADTLTPRGGVDARLYVKPASLLEAAEEIKLGISTTGERPEKTKRFFEKHFNNEVTVISCEQQGGFGASLQIAAKVKLPEDIENLTFYSYDSQNNSFSRIFTAYRVDANGYLRFATKKAGDIVISNGRLEPRAPRSAASWLPYKF